MFRRRFISWTLLLGIVAGFLGSAALVGDAPQIGFSGLPTTASNKTAFFAVIEARDIAGNRRSDVSDAHSLSAYARPWSGLLITEFSDNCDRIELMNAGIEPVDASGYSLSFQFGNRSPAVTFPPGSNLAPGETAVLQAPRFGTNRWPAIHFGGQQGLLVLRNAMGRVLDEVASGGSYAPYKPELWTGLGTATGDTGSTRQRMGSELRHSNTEWTTAPASFGRLNASLDFPRGGLRSPAIVTPELIVFTNGLWSGEIIVTAPAGLVTLAVDGGEGALSESEPIRFVVQPRLSLAVVSTNGPISEATSGRFASLTITRPAPLDAPVLVRLRSDYPGEITVPDSVTIPAGEISATVGITNLDDSIPDGHALVTIAASAPGFTDSAIELVNEDDEDVRAAVFLPEQILEQSGRNHQAGVISLSEPALHPIEVRLSADGLEAVDSRVVVPAGSRSARFSFVSSDDAYVNLIPKWITVSASVGAGIVTSTEIRIMDDEDRSWSVTYPPVINEGVPADITLNLACAADSPRRSGVVVSSPVVAPAEIFVPAGVTNFTIPVLYPTNGVRNDYAWTHWTAWVDTPPNPQFTSYQYVSIIDRDAVTDGIAWSMPSVLPSSRPTPVRLELTDGGRPAFTNVTGRLRIFAPGRSVSFAGSDTLPVPFTNGVFEGNLRLEGAGLGVEFEVEAAGINRRFGPVTVLDFWSPDGSYLDFAAIPGTSRVIASAGSVTNASGRLVEIDIASRTIVRQMTLPRPAAKLSVTPDGSVAWYGAVDGDLHRIDLILWRKSPGVSVLDRPTDGFSLESVLAAGGLEDRVVAAVLIADPFTGHRENKLVMFQGGMRLALTNPPPFRMERYNRELVAGRTANEFYVIDRSSGAGRLTRAVFENGGVTYGASSNIAGVGPNGVTLAEGRLWAGTSVRDPVTFEPAWPDRYSAETASILSFPAAGMTARLIGENLGIFDATDGRPLGSHTLGREAVGQGGLLKTAVAADVWFLRLYWPSAGGELVFSRSPIVDSRSASADISIRTLDDSNPAHPGYKTIETRNLGPGFAANCSLAVRTASETNRISIGNLPPGTAVTNQIAVAVPRSGVAETSVLANASPRDPDSGNNQLRIGVTNYPPVDPGTRELRIAVRRMVTSEDGNTIYATVGSIPDTAAPGVVAIDPAAGVVTRAFPLEDPSRLVVVNADALLVQSGYGKLVRMDLRSGVIRQEAVFTNTAITDFSSIPEDADQVVVTTTDGIYLYRNGVQTSVRSLFYWSENRVLTVVGNRIWSVGGSSIDIVPYSTNGLGQVWWRPFSMWGSPRKMTVAGNRLCIDAGNYGLLLDMDSVAAMDVTLPGLVVPDTRLGCFFGWSDGIVRLDGQSLGRTAYERRRYPEVASDYKFTMVRWGEQGFAVGGENDSLQLFESPIVKPGQDDLELSGRIENNPDSLGPVVWNLTVANRGSNMVEHANCSISYRPWEITNITLELDNETIRTVDSIHPLDVFDLGPIQAGGIKTLRFAGVIAGREIHLSAGAASMRNDASPGNNAARFDFVIPPTDLGLMLGSTPRRASVNEQQVWNLVITNLGVVAFHGRINLVVENLSEMIFVRSSLEAINEWQWAPYLSGVVRIEAGAALTVPVVLKTDVPGFYRPDFVLSAEGDDQVENNRATATVTVAAPASAATVVPVAISGSQVEWIPALQRLAVGTSSGINLVSPASFEERSIPVEGGLLRFKVCGDGRHIWALTGTSDLRRINLESGVQDPPLTSVSTNALFDFAPDRSDPEILYVLRYKQNNDFEAAAFKSGVELERAAPLVLGWGTLIQLISTAPGKCQIGNLPNIYELEVEDQGLHPSLQWNVPGAYGEIVGADEDRILFLNGLVYYKSSGRSVWRSGLLGYDPASRTAFAARQTGSWDDMSSILEMLSGSSELVWKLPIPGYRFDRISRIVPMGTSGILLWGPNSRIVKPEAWADEAVNWSLSALISAPRPRVGSTNLVSLSVTNLGVRTPRNPRIEIEMTDGIQLVDRPGTQTFSIPLNPEFGVTNLAFPVRFAASGGQHIQFRLTNDLPAASGTPVTIALDVEEAPRLWLVEGATTMGDEFRFGLSPRIDETISARYRIDWISTNGQLFASGEGTVSFSDGFSYAAISTYAVYAMSRGLSGSATITFTGESFANLPASFPLDFTFPEPPRSGLAVETTYFIEGDDGVAEARVPVILYGSSSLPVEVAYEATLFPAGTPLSHGRLRFSPGQTTNFVSFPVIGNRVFDGNSYARIRLFQPWNAFVYDPGVWSANIFENEPPPTSTAMVRIASDGSFRLGFVPAPNTVYTVQYSTNIASGRWFTVAEHLCPVSYYELPMESGDATRLYRVIPE